MSKAMLPEDVTLFAAIYPELASQCLYNNGELTWPDSLNGDMVVALDARYSGLALSRLKLDMKLRIDAAAEDERLKYITPGNGQAMTYQQKVAEAQAFKEATNPKAADYPLLSSEVGITAETLGAVADIVLAAFVQWQQIGAAIEVIRLGAKRDVDAAEDEAAARAVIDTIVWPSAQVLA